MAATRSIFRDITERKHYETELKRLATHDPLTNLQNRTFFSEQLSAALARGRESSSVLAVLFLDLDGFKLINDRYGHEQGDTLLRLFGSRVKTGLPEGVLVARFGGDEFLVLLENLPGIGRAGLVAQEVLDSLSQPFALGHDSVRLSASIGISLFPEDGDDVAGLIRMADLAMYEVKQRGKNGFAFYNSVPVGDLERIP